MANGDDANERLYQQHNKEHFGFVDRVLAERGGRLADPNMDVQPGRGARSIQRNLIKAITRGYQAEKIAKGIKDAQHDN